VLQASLGRLLAEPVQPIIDFNHKEDDAAASPTSFKWSEEGVVLALDWTSAGKAAVEGKTYRYFSPTFLLSEAGDPSSLPDTGPVGALTNNPAFRRMKRITAAEAAQTGDEGTETQKTKENMDKVTSKLVSLGFITEADASDPEKVTAALDAYSRKGSENAELATLRAENKTLRETAETQRVEAINREADLLIEAAVTAGKIAPKNETVKASLKRWAVTDLAGAKAHIESLPVNPAFKTVVQVTSAHRDIGKPKDTKDMNGNTGKQCDAKTRQVQARFPAGQMTYEAAWKIAAAEFPEVFETVEA
jgi:phage I-like protein